MEPACLPANIHGPNRPEQNAFWFGLVTVIVSIMSQSSFHVCTHFWTSLADSAWDIRIWLQSLDTTDLYNPSAFSCDQHRCGYLTLGAFCRTRIA